MALVGKSARIMKPTREIELATKPKTISHPDGGVFLIEENQEKAVYKRALSLLQEIRFLKPPSK